MKEFKFIDLFAGIGGFHQAMLDLGGKCVFASEIDNYAIETYIENYGINPAHDINDIKVEDLPKYDVLCAGFPCQPFSKAGDRLGFEDKTKGTLFFQIARILKYTEPKYVILENVRNIVGHDNGNTFRTINETLDSLGYNHTHIIMSPHQLGIPQLRERVYILCVRNDIFQGDLEFNIPIGSKDNLNVYESDLLELDTDKKYNISEYEEKVLTCWNEFYQGINQKIIGFPIWVSEFKKNYDISVLPNWKANFCLKNRKLYIDNKKFIEGWLKKWNNLENFTPTHQKFEWQAGTKIDSIWDGFVQFRPSGVRVKAPTAFPALVAMVQVPIVAKYKRRLTPREVARLQSFPDSFIPNRNDYQAYKQFGNAVNVICVKYLAKQLFDF